MVFPRDAAPAAENSRIKFSRQAEKASANFSGAKIRSAHFPAGGIFVSGLAGKRPRAQRFPAACTFLFGTNRPKSPVYIQQPQRPIRQSPNAFFLQLRFSRRENTRCIFFQHPKPSFPAWPANISRCQSYYNLQQDNSFPSGTSRPTPPAAILFIPALTILNQPTSFLPAWPADALHSSPPFFQNPPIAIFPNILPAFAFPYLQLQSHPTTFSTPSTSSVLLPLFQTAAQTRNVVSRAGAACKAADGAGEEPAFFLSFLFFSPLFFPLFFSFPSPWRRGFAATPSFFFLLLFFFLFFLFVFLLLFLLFSFCFFSLYFYSDFLFLFFLCPFFLLFLSFYFCSYLCFFCILFLLLFLSLLFFLVFIFVFLSFFFIFASPFLFLSFFLFYFFTLLTPISFLIIQPLADHSFFLFRRQSFPSHPVTSRQQQKEKNIGKRIHGGEMAFRERTGGGRKDRGTEWSPERDGKKCILRGMEQWAERNEWREEID